MLGTNLQRTVKSSVTFRGAGLHSGAPATMTIHPASAEHGVWFRRCDVDGADQMIPARWDVVEQVPLCTRLVNRSGVSVSTVEHVMAALAGCGVHNALIDVDGPEIPILDGSAAPFVRAILTQGLIEQQADLRAIEILAPVDVKTDTGWARLSPAKTLTMDFHIDFSDAAIGSQDKTLVLSNGTFVRELSDSRTFCRQSDVDQMHANGLALGGTLENAVVVDGDRVLSPGGLRHADEAVRHKMLDALGDLALAGAPILGHYSGYRAGHAMTNQLLRVLFATPQAFRMVACKPATAAMLPGVGVDISEIPVLHH